MGARHDAAVEAFVAARSTDLLRTAVLLTRDRGHAQDLLQIALVRAYRHWGRIDGEDPYPYVRKILVTAAAGWRRLRATQEIVSLPAHDAADGRRPGRGPAARPGHRRPGARFRDREWPGVRRPRGGLRGNGTLLAQIPLTAGAGSAGAASAGAGPAPEFVPPSGATVRFLDVHGTVLVQSPLTGITR